MSVRSAIGPVLDHLDQTVGSARETARNVRDTYKEGRRAAPKVAKNTQHALTDGVDQFIAQSKDMVDSAGEQIDTARLYAVERVQERPFTATLAALSAGFVLGLLFAGNRR